MHRWLCTTAPLLIGTIAVGTIHAAPVSGSCPGMQRAPRPHAGQHGASDAESIRMLAASIAVDPLRICAGCHDGTVARVEGDMHSDEFVRSSQGGFMPVRFGVRP